MNVIFYASSFWFSSWTASFVVYGFMDMKNEMKPGKMMHFLTVISILFICLIIFSAQLFIPEHGWRIYKNSGIIVSYGVLFLYRYIERLR